MDGEQLFKSRKIVTLAITSYINTGGAHGALQISLLNFNAKTGKKIDNDNLFTNIEAFKTIAKTCFEVDTASKNQPDVSQKFKLPVNIGITKQVLF